MKRFAGKLFLILAIFLLSNSFRSAAQPFETAGEYMDYITKANQSLTEKYLFYLSGMSHGKSAKKVEKRRQDLLKSISDTRYNIMGMPSFKGDRTLKDTTVAYLKILNSVFNEDYGKIVNMEEIAEQSYDLMEAYMLAKDKANEKLNDASKRQHAMQVKFAEKNNIRLIESQSELDAKMDIASAVMEHHNEVYLIFFKCYKQEIYLTDALNRKNIVSIEQNLNALQKYAEEGLQKLNDLKGYNGDPSLIIACRNALNFYKDESAKGAGLTDYILKEENFNKIKKQFDSKPSSKRTQQDVDQFNKAVNDINTAGKNYNTINNDLNKQRATALNDWDKAVAKYMDQYMPTQR
jgi:hypothetical protein